MHVHAGGREEGKRGKSERSEWECEERWRRQSLAAKWRVLFMVKEENSEREREAEKG